MFRKRFGVIGLLLLMITAALYLFLFIGLPGNLSITKNNESIINFDFPFSLYIDGQANSNLLINGHRIGEESLKVSSGSKFTVLSDQVGQVSLDLKLFGIIPLRTITVNVLPDVKVYPGGQAIGVLLRSNGVMVVGNSFVESNNGNRYYPAREAGVDVGDIITEINGREIQDKMELAALIQDIADSQKSLSLTIKKKNGEIKTVKVTPVKNKQGSYMIGIYVDDGVAGVGTLTFHEQQSKEYGALGHVITESNSQIEIEVREGQIVEAQISGINYGRKGLPGEKLGTFFQADNVLGKISSNTRFGIFGTLNRTPRNPYFKKPIPVAAISQVKPGPAKIYTVVQGGKIEEFTIHIDKVYKQSVPGPKGMIISITDPELKKLTGGIIQGMSGSPIVQNGALVGAITHVFINDPTKGYGVFAEWMILQTNIYKKARVANY